MLPIVAILAFLVGVGVGAGGEEAQGPTDGEDRVDELGEELADVEQERDELEETLEERDRQIDDLTEQLEEREEALPDDEPASDELDFAGLNERVELPPWRFNVKEVRCGQQEMVYDSGVGEEERHIPQGQYCQAIMTIENIGTAPDSWNEDASALLDTEGIHYEYDFDATYWGNIRDDHRDFGSRLNPGQAAPGSVWFDIPADAEPALLVLLPDPYSDNSVGIRLTDETGGD